MRICMTAVCALALTAPAVAQDASPCAVVSAILTKARETGALDRVLAQPVYLVCEQPGQEGVLKFSCELVGERDAPTALRCTAVAWRNGGQRTLVQEIGFDGRLRHASAEGLAPGFRGRREQAPGGGTELTRSGEAIERVVRRDGGEQREQLKWSDQVLPGLVVGFVLTRLFDQGLPEDFTFRLCDGLSLEDQDTRLTSGGLDEEGRRIIHCVTQAGNVGLVRYSAAVIHEGEQAGTLLGGRFDVWSREAPVFRAVSAEAALQLLQKQE